MSIQDKRPVYPTRFTNDGDRNTSAPDGQVVAPGDSVDLPGLLLRQHYALKAPAEIPEWFTYPRRTPEPPLPTSSHLNDRDRGEFNSLRNQTMHEADATPAALAFYLEWKQANDKLNEWREFSQVERFFAWRWFYADMMLVSERSFPTDPEQDLRRTFV